MSQPKVSIVLPNWNGVKLLGKHLAHVIAASPGSEIIVADDASVDGSVEYLKKTFPGVVVVESDRNRGFAGNVNRGVARATGDIVVLLNTDVEPEKGWLEPLIRHFSDPSVFAVGCLEKSHEGEKVVTRGRGLSRWEKGFFIHSRGETDKRTTAWVSGGSGAFRRQIWDLLGGLDELYSPFYWEDIDLSYRAIKSGYSVMFEPESVVHHWHEQGSIKTSFSPADVKRIVYRNQFIFHWKNLTDLRILATHWCRLPIVLLRAFMGRDTVMIKGLFLAVSKFGLIRKSRKHQSKLWRKADVDCVLPRG